MFAGAFCLLAAGQTSAEVITVDGVYDETPGQSYSAVGGTLQVSMTSGSSPYTLKIGPVASKQENVVPYGENAKIEMDYGLLDTPKNVEKVPKKVTIKVSTSGRVANLSKETKVVIPRDTQNPSNNFDKRYHVVIKSFTPGLKGKPGIIDVAIEPL
ncbi:MAG: hypothetical protein ACK5TR_08680 [Alphaproteobacteria bacterium]|nr:hypothetical protein [Alphaproteobacteria bacterium]